MYTCYIHVTFSVLYYVVLHFIGAYTDSIIFFFDFVITSGKRLQKTMEKSTHFLMGKLTINGHFQ